MLIESSDSRHVLEVVGTMVSRLKPGQRVKVSRRMLRDIQTHVHNDVLFTAADRVLENIIGAGYTHDYTIDPQSGDVIFARYENTGERRYVSPDRRAKT